MTPHIDHLVVLALENRSFDNVLGFLPHPNEHYEGLRKHRHSGNRIGRRFVRATPDGRHVLPSDGDHSHEAVMAQLRLRGTGQSRRATNRGFAASYEAKGAGLGPPRAYEGLLGPVAEAIARWLASRSAPGAGLGPLVMRCLPPGKVPVLSTLALRFGVCDHWFSSVPGETWPNRNYMHAATSHGAVDIEAHSYHDPTIFQILDEYLPKDPVPWRIYFDDVPQVAAFDALWHDGDGLVNQDRWRLIDKFFADANIGDLARYTFIEPNHNPIVHLPGRLLTDYKHHSSSQHPNNNRVPRDGPTESPATYSDPSFENCPGCDFWQGERLIARVYEALRSNPEVFERTILLITYDEHGGLYDHVSPPIAPPPSASPALADRPNLVKRLVI